MLVDKSWDATTSVLTTFGIKPPSMLFMDATSSLSYFSMICIKALWILFYFFILGFPSSISRIFCMFELLKIPSFSSSTLASNHSCMPDGKILGLCSEYAYCTRPEWHYHNSHKNSNLKTCVHFGRTEYTLIALVLGHGHNAENKQTCMCTMNCLSTASFRDNSVGVITAFLVIMKTMGQTVS